MAQKNRPETVTTEGGTVKAPRVKVDPSVRKAVNALREIAACYRDASIALAKGDDIATGEAIELAKRYSDLYAELGKKAADVLTSEGLAQVNEM